MIEDRDGRRYQPDFVVEPKSRGEMKDEAVRAQGRDFVDADGAENRSNRLTALSAALLEDFRVIVITLGAEDDAQVIFETLNSGGEPLAAMDLVHNDVFHRATRAG